jgi:alkaline phosphatase/alkaline phosphatase D
MRKKWHEQFAQQRYHDLFAEVPTYWEKDDHDLRYDDCDSTDTPRSLDTRLPLPTFGEGQRLFREQLPLGDPDDPTVRPYRTHRVSMDMQIWLLEGRDFRSPNLMADGPEKTLWGIEQRAWLQETLLASDATFKIIVSPTPLVGPDDLRKKDNHTNLGGFRYEGDAFFTWAEANGFLEKGLYIVCGDRHWQYHAVHPTGFEEFSSGALVDGNARLGVAPGDPQGTDPQAQIQQRFVSPEPSGGFLEVEVVPGDPAILRFNFFDENGDLLYAAEKSN